MRFESGSSSNETLVWDGAGLVITAESNDPDPAAAARRTPLPPVDGTPTLVTTVGRIDVLSTDLLFSSRLPPSRLRSALLTLVALRLG